MTPTNPAESTAEDSYAYSAEAIAAGVHFLYALSSELTPSPAPTPGPGSSAEGSGEKPRSGRTLKVTPGTATEVGEILRGQGASDAEVENVVALIRAGLAAVEQGRAQTFTKDAYEAARERAAAGLEHVGAAGHRIWPPTSQTVRKRIGSNYWNEALEALGYPVSGRGRARGAARYSPADFLDAVADFLAAASESGTTTSFVGYEAWSREQKTGTRKRPSGAAVRAHFGSWQAAKDAVGRL